MFLVCYIPIQYLARNPCPAGCFTWFSHAHRPLPCRDGPVLCLFMFFLPCLTAVGIIETHDVIFAKITAGLHFD